MIKQNAGSPTSGPYNTRNTKKGRGTEMNSFIHNRQVKGKKICYPPNNIERTKLTISETS